ncbi:MAG TPA: ATP phosphoribosyltransferase [Rhodospirillaceae bacterium]|jgi:ATP phosphoribosyltransferase|nr:ATP phosphoribosyltransferase [Alphaproteobacteria bacterium]HBH26966.1 ATP phosphoribosyltransferase [Rhodospirillaceae bacterium]
METIVLALPKGRIAQELAPRLAAAGVEPEAAFADPDSRKLRFATARADLDIIRVRAFDVATFVARGGAQIGVVGSDVIEEFTYPGLYAPVDLGIGRCRLALAAPVGTDAAVLERASHVTVATKYPRLTARHFAQRGIQAECVHLHGAMEIAPALGLAPFIVDLVSTGGTLRANGLAEVETLLDVSARLIVNRAAWKTAPGVLAPLVDGFGAL